MFNQLSFPVGLVPSRDGKPKVHLLIYTTCSKIGRKCDEFEIMCLVPGFYRLLQMSPYWRAVHPPKTNGEQHLRILSFVYTASIIVDNPGRPPPSFGFWLPGAILASFLPIQCHQFILTCAVSHDREHPAITSLPSLHSDIRSIAICHSSQLIPPLLAPLFSS